MAKADSQAASESDVTSDMFEENFKELKKWVDVKSSKYGVLSVYRERHHGRLGTALKVLLLLGILSMQQVINYA